MVEVGGGRGKEKPHNPRMISVRKVRIRPGKGKGKLDGWLPQPLTHNTRRVCTDDPETKLPVHSLCSTRECTWEREWYGVTTPNIISWHGVILFPFVVTPPLIGDTEEVVAAKPLGAFNRDRNDLVVTTGERLVVNHLIEHNFLSNVQVDNLLEDLVWKIGCLSQKRHPLSMRSPPLWAGLKIQGPPLSVWQLWGSQPPQAQPPQAPRSANPEKGRRSCA